MMFRKPESFHRKCSCNTPRPNVTAVEEEDDDEDAKLSSVQPLVPPGHHDNVVSVSFKPKECSGASHTPRKASQSRSCSRLHSGRISRRSCYREVAPCRASCESLE